MKRVLILGSTGSIGVQALEVISESTGLEVAGLAAGTNHALLVEQARAFDVEEVAIVDETSAGKVVAELTSAKVLSGPGCIKGLVEQVDCDLVLNAVVGAAGLEATIATIKKGVDLALANKESLVVGGELVMAMARESGVAVLPVDSEHSAIFQCLEGRGENAVEHIFITASGGPFFGRSRDELSGVTREDALDHPRWKMGSKITIDSATLMNKGLEIIEARFLFDVPYERIDVLVHPQSIVHSLVRYDDGSVMAQLGLPSMKLPIAYALNYPERLPVVMPQLDLVQAEQLTFFQPDLDAFPCLRIAREAGERGGGAPIVINAANEVAVANFLSGRIGFLQIAEIVGATLAGMDDDIPARIENLRQVYECDADARCRAESLVE
jgi:1-deoxy-D-xylulose-5-phosphate reductoisomerase